MNGDTNQIYKVKASADLFNANRQIRSKLQTLSFLINADGHVDHAQLERARLMMIEAKGDFQQWWTDLLTHIENCNK